MKLTDEQLNKYIDGELSASEVRDLKDHISDNPEALENLKALKLVDDVLREMEFESAPKNITEKIMNRLNVGYSAKKESNKFFKVVLTLFGLGFLGVFGFGLTQVSGTPVSKNEDFFESIFNKIGSILPSFNFSFDINSETMMLIVSSLVLITLVATYVFINFQKTFKQNISNLSH